MASKLVLVVVFVVDLIAFALAVAAEQRRSSARVEHNAQSNNNYCVYDSDISTTMGVVSLVLLIVSQILVMAISRCLCCGRALSPGRSRARAIAFFIICWVTFFIAEVCLLAGSLRNGYHTKYVTGLTSDSCKTLKRGVFGAGAAFIVCTGIFSSLFYITYSKAKDSLASQGRDSGIRMGSL